MPTAVHQVTVPPADEGAAKPWRKLLRALDETQPGGSACQGFWLEPGAVYELPAGALIVGCDRTETTHRTRLWRVTRAGVLKAERDSSFAQARSAFGESIRKTLRTALANHPAELTTPPRQVTAAPPRPNSREDRCARCGQTVPAGAGRLVRDRGRAVVEHDPVCPPRPPLRNQYPGVCRYCAGWLAAEEGVLVDLLGALVPVHGATPDSCPPSGQRKSAPPRENLRPGACVRCGRTVPAGEGVLDGGRVRHRGDCPAYGDGSTGPTWRIGYGEPRPYRPVPTGGYRLGQVLRATLYEHEHPVPAGTPGYGRDGEQRVSAIVTVLAELPPRYVRDEDGNSPCTELIGEDGWYFEAAVRPATEQEATPLLAVEAQHAHRADLERQRLSLLSWRYAQQPDAQRPQQPDLDAAIRVPFRSGRHGHWATIEDEIRVDEPAGMVWTLAYNGGDGDDWSINNHGSYIATVQPLTDERRALVAELRAEYAVADLAERAGVGADAAATLVEAGWTAERATTELGALALTAAADVAAALAHQDVLAAAGWLVRAEPGRHRFPLAEAVELARAGVDPAHAVQLAAAGTPAAQMPTAAAPSIPDDATRIVIKPVDVGPAVITGGPATARAWLARHPDRWRADLLTIATGIRCVHTDGDWSLWDDGSLVVRSIWLDPAERDQVPRTLQPAAVTAIGLVARGGAGSSVRDRAVWHPLRAATGHVAAIVEERERTGEASWAGKKLIRHEFALGDHAAIVWWELATFDGGWAGGDADHNEHSRVWPEEGAARAAYRSHQL